MEPDSKTVFLVQLSAILSQVRNVLQAGAGSSSSAAISGLKNTVDDWIKAVEEASSPISSAEAAMTQTHASEDTLELSVGSNEPLPGSNSSSGPTGVPSFTLPAGDDIGSYTLVELVQFIGKLFSAECTEAGKLRNFGRNLIHLIQIRCTSALREALHFVALLSYGHVDKHSRCRSVSSAQRDGAATLQESSCSPFGSAVHLAKRIRSSASALTECMELAIFQVDHADKNSLRFPLQISVDTLKHIYKMLNKFALVLEKRELSQMTEESRLRLLKDREFLDQVVDERLKELWGVWGTSLTLAISRITLCVSPIVAFLVSIAGQSATVANSQATDSSSSSSAISSAIGSDATHALFAFAPKRGESAGPSSVAHTERFGASFFGAVLLARLDANFTAEFIASLSSQCGDDSEGSLVSTRIVTDTLQCIAGQSSALLKCFISQRWRYRLFDGILTRIVSMHPAVLSSGLEDLQLITTTCAAGPSRGSTMGAEIGNLYTGCVFRLLESPNCPMFAKQKILMHLLKTFLQPTRVDAEEESTASVPLLLLLYHRFDLDPHAHALAVVQQFIALLSRIVRVTTPTEFVKDTEAQTELLKKLKGSKANAGGDSDAETMEVYQQSLPLLALHGLVVAVEVLRKCVPPESLVDGAVTRLLPPCDLREKKQKEQYIADVFSKSAKKAIQMLTVVTPEMTHPEGSEEFLQSCEAIKLPKPATEEIAAKVELVAEFIYTVPTLNAQAVSDYVTTPEVFALQVCHNLMKRLPLRGLHLVDALDELLFTFSLPKEGQRIERLLEYFCDAYFDANQDADIDRSVFPFADKDACFLVGVATVMLNTNLHNPLATSKMSEEAFCGQLTGCNGPEELPTSFTRSIYLRIARSPFRSAISPALVQTAAENVATSRGIDSLFISSEERKHIAFGLERQRILMDVHQALHSRRVASPPRPPAESLWWPRIARDLFLSTWSSVCAVFGPAMYDGAAAPEAILPKCVRGLHALLCVATSFALSTEGEVTLLAILRLCDFESVKVAARKALLAVAASPYAIFLSVRCWGLLLGLIGSLHNESHTLATQIENVFARIEGFMRCKESQSIPKAEGESEAQEGREGPGEASAAEETIFSAETAVQRILEAAINTVMEVPSTDSRSLEKGLKIIERCLGYTRIQHSSDDGAVEITNCINIQGFRSIVLPGMRELVSLHRDNDDVLGIIRQCVVRLFTTLWSSYTVWTTDKASQQELGTQFFLCFDFFRDLFDQSIESSSVQAWVVECSGEVATTLLSLLRNSPLRLPPLFVIFSVWRRVLYPFAISVCHPQLARSELNGFSNIVLRKIVATCTNQQSPLPAQLAMTAAVLLLGNACYIGAMCSEGDTAHTCVSLLSSLCTTALAIQKSLLETLPERSKKTRPKRGSPSGDSIILFPPSAETHLEAFVEQLKDSPRTGFILTHLLERLCLVLRSEKVPIREEALENIKKFLPHLHLKGRDMYRHAATLLCHALLSGTIFSSAPVTLVDPALIAFWLFAIKDVPQTMRRCSRGAFRSSVQPILRVMTSDLLAACPTLEREGVAELIMERCLTVLVVSPHCTPATRTLSASFLAPCVECCAVKGCRGNNVRNVLLRCIAFILSTTAPSASAEPPGGEGKPQVWERWVAKHNELCGEEKEIYMASVTAGQELLAAMSNPRRVTGGMLGNSTFDVLCAAAEESENPPSEMSRQVSSAESANPTDLTVVDYYNLLTNLFSGVPKAFSAVRRGCPGSAIDDLKSPCPTSALESSYDESCFAMMVGWSAPVVPPHVLLCLIVEVMSSILNHFWCLNHPDDRGGLAAATKALSAMPHTAVRGVMNSYLESALQCSSYPLGLLRSMLGDVTTLIQALQENTSRGLHEDEENGSVEMHMVMDAQSMQQLSSQQQQYLKNCNNGMFHELCEVLQVWIERLTPSSIDTEREREIAAISADTDLCGSLVQLLPTKGDPLVMSVTLYLKWLMRHDGGVEQLRGVKLCTR